MIFCKVTPRAANGLLETWPMIVMCLVIVGSGFASGALACRLLAHSYPQVAAQSALLKVAIAFPNSFSVPLTMLLALEDHPIFTAQREAGLFADRVTSLFVVSCKRWGLHPPALTLSPVPVCVVSAVRSHRSRGRCVLDVGPLVDRLPGAHRKLQQPPSVVRQGAQPADNLRRGRCVRRQRRCAARLRLGESGAPGLALHTDRRGPRLLQSCPRAAHDHRAGGAAERRAAGSSRLVARRVIQARGVRSHPRGRAVAFQLRARDPHRRRRGRAALPRSDAACRRVCRGRRRSAGPRARDRRGARIGVAPLGRHLRPCTPPLLLGTEMRGLWRRAGHMAATLTVPLP